MLSEVALNTFETGALQTARIVRDSYYRATRNCPWVGELWVRYLLAQERSHASEEELSSVCIYSIPSMTGT